MGFLATARPAPQARGATVVRQCTYRAQSPATDVVFGRRQARPSGQTTSVLQTSRHTRPTTRMMAARGRPGALSAVHGRHHGEPVPALADVRLGRAVVLSPGESERILRAAVTPISPRVAARERVPALDGLAGRVRLQRRREAAVIGAHSPASGARRCAALGHCCRGSRRRRVSGAERAAGRSLLHVHWRRGPDPELNVRSGRARRPTHAAGGRSRSERLSLHTQTGMVVSVENSTCEAAGLSSTAPPPPVAAPAPTPEPASVPVLIPAAEALPAPPTTRRHRHH